MNPTSRAPHHRRRRFASIFLVLVALAIAGFLTFIYIRGTPQYSLYQFRNAIINHDPERAFVYLDVDSVVDNLVKETYPDETKPDDPSTKAPGKGKYNIAKDAVTQNLPAVKIQLKEQLEAAIRAYNDQAVLEKLGSASILGLAISVEGDKALVKIRGRDKVGFRMAKSSEGRWRIVAINLKELMPASSK